jgi:hypothetical protein
MESQSLLTDGDHGRVQVATDGVASGGQGRFQGGAAADEWIENYAIRRAIGADLAVGQAERERRG